MENTKPGQSIPIQSTDDINKDLEKHKAFIKASNIGAWEYFADREYLWFNDIYFSMLGRNIEDYPVQEDKNLLNVWIDLLHPDDRDEAVNAFANYLKNPA